MNTLDDEVNRGAIEQARRRIAADVRRTPLMRVPGSTLGVACTELWLKLEHLQIGGSFKARGMFNRMRTLAVPTAGVVVASGGNAGIAVAHAARALGVRCEVFVPEVSSPAKRAALSALQAHVVVGGAAYADALAACLQRQAASGALLMHAYDQPEVVVGAGTLAAEIEEDAGVPDRVLVSVGGGGLVAGVAAWFDSRCRVEALEPVGSPTLPAGGAPAQRRQHPARAAHAVASAAIGRGAGRRAAAGRASVRRGAAWRR
jgi:threonine dehydratase